MLGHKQGSMAAIQTRSLHVAHSHLARAVGSRRGPRHGNGAASRRIRRAHTAPDETHRCTYPGGAPLTRGPQPGTGLTRHDPCDQGKGRLGSTSPAYRHTDPMCRAPLIGRHPAPPHPSSLASHFFASQLCSSQGRKSTRPPPPPSSWSVHCRLTRASREGGGAEEGGGRWARSGQRRRFCWRWGRACWRCRRRRRRTRSASTGSPT